VEIFVKGRNRTISLLYEAALNPSLWPSALAAFADLTQCRDVILSVIDKKRGQPRVFLSGSRVFPPEALRAYLAHYYKVDPLLQSAAAARPAGTLLLCHEYVSPDVVARNETYQDYVIPLGGRYMGGWALENNEATLAAVTMQARDAPFERKKVARWGSMALHARQAVLLSLARCCDKPSITQVLFALWWIGIQNSWTARLPPLHCLGTAVR
jgi:hypothetical protein